jgi:hypothetical protein
MFAGGMEAEEFGQKTPENYKVVSRVVCKSMERVLGPMLVHTIKDAEKYSIV